MFKFGNRSLQFLATVHADLQKVAALALTYSDIDFGITEGIRTVERQKDLVASGASHTMKSRHLTGHAIDVVANLGGEIRWDWGLYVKIAYAFQKAAKELGVDLEWGGAWVNLVTTKKTLEDAVADYVAQSKKDKKKPLLDGPHFQLSFETYPAK